MFCRRHFYPFTTLQTTATDAKDGSATNEKTLLCTNCDHTVDEGPLEDQCFATPEWYYNTIYKDTGLTRVSDFFVFT